MRQTSRNLKLVATASIIPIASSFLNCASAALVINSSAPNTNVLSSSGIADGGINTRLIDEGVNANHARGQVFALGDTGAGPNIDQYEITAISFQKSSGSTTYVNDLLSVFFFEGTLADFNAGTGHSTAIDGGNYYVDTTVTPLASETVTLNTTINDNDWITVNLDVPILVDENSDYGFFFVYEQVDGASDDIDHRESDLGPGGTGGDRISITTTNHGSSDRRKMDYIVQGTAVPEPSSLALLALGGLAIARRRR